MAEMRQAGHNPGIMGRKDIETGGPFRQEHLPHFLGPRPQRVIGRMLALGNPFANARVEFFIQYGEVLVKIANKEISQGFKNLNRGSLGPADRCAAFPNALSGFYAAAHRAGKIDGISRRREEFSQIESLFATLVGKADKSTAILVRRSNMAAFPVTNQQVNPGIWRKGFKKIPGKDVLIHRL